MVGDEYHLYRVCYVLGDVSSLPINLLLCPMDSLRVRVKIGSYLRLCALVRFATANRQQIKHRKTLLHACVLNHIKYQKIKG